MKFKRLLPLIGLIILIFIISTLDFNEIFRIFTNINPIYILLSFFAFFPLFLLVTFEWQLLLKSQKINVSFWYSIKNFLIGYFFGFITPGGFGAYTRSLYLSEESGAPLPKCFSNIITFNTIEFLSMLSAGFVGAIFLSSVYPYLFLIILFVFLVVLILYLFFFKSASSRHLFKKIVQCRIFAGMRDKLETSIESFHEDLPGFRDVILPFILAIGGRFLKFTMLFFIARLFEINIPFQYFILIMVVADVIASIPISIYGIGTREAALITMFSFPQLTNGVFVIPEQIISFSLFWFVIFWLTPSVIGAFFTFYESNFRHNKKNDKKYN